MNKLALASAVLATLACLSLAAPPLPTLAEPADDAAPSSRRLLQTFPDPNCQRMLASDQFNNLWDINHLTGLSSNVRVMAPPGLTTEIEFDPVQQQLWAESSPSVATFSTLYQINPATGAQIGPSFPHPQGGAPRQYQGMEFVGGVLHAAAFQPLSSITDFVTFGFPGETIVGPTGVPFPFPGLAYDTQNGIMYGVAHVAHPQSAELFTINMATGAATLIGPIIDGASSIQLDFVGSIEFGPDGQLYGGISRGGGSGSTGVYPPGTFFRIVIGSAAVPSVATAVGPGNTPAGAITGLTCHNLPASNIE